MRDFNWNKMSKVVYPSGANETEYLRFEDNGTWTASSRDQVCILSNTNLGYAVAVLNAKLHPINCEERDRMILSLQNRLQYNSIFLEKYGAYPQWKSDVKDARKGIARLEKEIERLNGMQFL